MLALFAPLLFKNNNEAGKMHNKKYVLSIDQGTTSSKALLFDRQGNRVAISRSTTHALFYPQNGFVEQDAEEIYNEICRIAKDVLEQAGATSQEVVCLSLSVQTGVLLFWEKKTGKPVYNLIGWQCARGQDAAEALTQEEQEHICRISGTHMNGHCIAAKMQWMFENVQGLYERVKSGEVLMGTDESYLVWRLTGGACHPIEYNNACTTKLFDFTRMAWDPYMLQKLHLTAEMLPTVLPSDACFGVVTEPGLEGIEIWGVLWDSCAALFSHRSYSVGDAKASYGTGTTVVINVGTAFPHMATDCLTVGWGANGKITYLRQANSVCTGATVKWLADALELIPNVESAEVIASTVADTDGVYLVPAFSGLTAPYFDDKARACIVGMTRSTNKAHIVRAGLESIAYQVKAMLDSVRASCEYPCKKLFADSGASGNKLLMQFQADLLGIQVVCENIPEASGVGMAYFGGLACGFYASIEELAQLSTSQRIYEPTWDENTREWHYRGWEEAVRKSRSIL